MFVDKNSPKIYDHERMANSPCRANPVRSLADSVMVFLLAQNDLCYAIMSLCMQDIHGDELKKRTPKSKCLGRISGGRPGEISGKKEAHKFTRFKEALRPFSVEDDQKPRSGTFSGDSVRIWGRFLACISDFRLVTLFFGGKCESFCWISPRIISQLSGMIRANRFARFARIGCYTKKAGCLHT